ncbi:MAG: hypothetical protein M3P70_07600, partial [Actinomycetota bacterium]|nr:hypothetical protein [Actinomycetota bacterium]
EGLPSGDRLQRGRWSGSLGTAAATVPCGDPLAALSVTRQPLAKDYEERHGKKPGPYTLTLMAEHVTLRTRAKKPDRVPERDELLDSWNAKAMARGADGLARVAAKVAATAKAAPLLTEQVLFVPGEAAQRTLEALTATKAVWTRFDLIAELNRQLPDQLTGVEPEQVAGLLEEVAGEFSRW